MKKFLTSLTFLFACIQSSAQVPQTSLPGNYALPSGGASYYICLIQYTYDASGNRIHREYSCYSSGGGGGSPRLAQPTTATNTNEVLESIVFPNPTASIFKVSTNKPLENATVNVYTMQGMRVQTYPYNGSEQTYNIAYLADGQYLIELVSAQAKHTKKISKQNK
jgi:hypothetical protein